jgi:hypothetical protein
METLLLDRLKSVAWKKSKPFCYGCYKEAPSGRCSSCHSDDLMRLVDGVGVEWGIDWVIKHLVEENLTPADTSAAFEESVGQCYPETVTIGWITYDTTTAIKELDPVSWRLAKSEWADQEVEAENLVTFDGGSTYVWRHELEQYLDETEAELALSE